MWNLSWSFSFNVNKFTSFVCALWNILPHLNRLVRASPRRSLWLTGPGITSLIHNVPHLQKHFHFSWTNKQPQSRRNLLSYALESATKEGSSRTARPPDWHRLSIFYICLNFNVFHTFEPGEVERERGQKKLMIQQIIDSKHLLLCHSDRLNGKTSSPDHSLML